MGFNISDRIELICDRCGELVRIERGGLVFRRGSSYRILQDSVQVRCENCTVSNNDLEVLPLIEVFRDLLDLPIYRRRGRPPVENQREVKRPSYTPRTRRTLPPLVSRWGREGWVYVITYSQWPGLYKVGQTRADQVLEGRFFATDTPELPQVVLSGRVKDRRNFESTLHYRFRSKREVREWFRLTLDDLEEIKLLLKGREI